MDQALQLLQRLICLNNVSPTGPWCRDLFLPGPLLSGAVATGPWCRVLFLPGPLLSGAVAAGPWCRDLFKRKRSGHRFFYHNSCMLRKQMPVSDHSLNRFSDLLFITLTASIERLQFF